MKNKTIVKIIATVAALAALSAMAFAVSATDTEATKPEIFSQNVEYSDKFSLMYAVDATTVTGETVTLTVTGGDTTWSQTIDATEANKQTVKGTSAYVFTTPGVGPQDFATQYTVTATSGDATSEAKRYSIAEYLGERLYKNGIAAAATDADATRKEFYLSTLEFAANAGKVLNIDTNPDNDVANLVTDYYYVYTELGTIDGAYSAGVYLNTDSLTFTPTDATKKYQILTIAEDGSVDEDAGVEIASGEAFTVSANSVIVEKPSYKVGSGKFYNMGTTVQNATEGIVRIADFDATTTPLVTNPKEADGYMDSSVVNGVSQHSLLSAYTSYIRVDNTGTNTLTDHITVSEFDMMYSGFYVPSNTESYFLNLRLYDGNGDSHYIYMVKNDDGTLSLGEANTAKIKAGEWFNVRLEIVYNSDSSASIDIYINNVYATTMTFADFESGCYRTWITVKSSMYDSTEGAEQGTVYVDNMFFGLIEPSYKTTNN